jgi:hypothetical protein
MGLFSRKKKFAIPAARLQPLAVGHGSCTATDRITVEGRRVGFMYRERSHGVDSGWRFFAGDEPPDYTDNPKNIEVYDVNTIANHDPEIVPLLSEPPGTAFIRAKKDGPLVRDEGWTQPQS